MKSNIKRLGMLLIVGIMAFSICACSDKTTDPDESEAPNETDANMEEHVESQVVSRSSLGITLDLSMEYADCEITDLTSEHVEELAPGAIGGFSINKTVGDSSYTLANVLVVPNTSVDTPEKRAGFPYIFSGSTYSVVGLLPIVDATGEDYEQASQLQTGILNQLCTIFFDEQTLIGSLGGEVDTTTEAESTESTEITDGTSETDNIDE